jgi:DNA-binding NarL/FixJ family response regulator
MKTQILIADDHGATRRILGELLKSHDGWEVCAAVENGQQALLKATEFRPDIIILDLAMPVVDGLQAAREIAKVLPSVPVLVYTLHDASWIEVEAKKAGVRRIISKTQSAESLVSAVEQLLKNEMQELTP